MVYELLLRRYLQLWRLLFLKHAVVVFPDSSELLQEIPAKNSSHFQAAEQQGMKYVWLLRCSQAMKTAKQLLITSKLLTHYDSTLPLKLAANASQ